MKFSRILMLLFLASLPYAILAQAPTITSVTSSTGDGTYGIGDPITITVTFSEAVEVTGTPTLELETGTTDYVASYSGDGTASETLTFAYTVQNGDESLDLDYISSSALALNAGSILADDDAAIADLTTLPVPGAAGSLGANQAIVIDGVAPVVSSILYNTPATSPTNATELVFQVTFSENVTGVTTDDFTLTSSDPTGTISSVSSATGDVIDVTVTSVSGSGTIQLDLKGSGTGITDVVGNAISGGYTTGEEYTIDQTAPSVSSILYDTPATSPTNATELVFQVTFSESVTGVGTGDFTLTTSGPTATISSVSSATGDVIDVTVTSVSGSGTIRLDLNNSGTGIEDAAGNAISGGYTTGEVYTIDQTAPSVSSILYNTPATSPTNATELVFQVTFSEIVSGVGIGDFTLTSSDPTGTISSVSSATGDVIDVTVSSVSGNGTLRLDLNSSGTGIEDALGNAISGGYTTGDVYTIDQTAPSVSSILYNTPATSPTNATTLIYEVTFSENVSGVSTDDFVLTTSGASGTIISVSSSTGTVIDVTINTVTGNGTIRLDLENSGTGIVDDNGNAISGGFTSGDVYTIDNIAPSVSSILYSTPASSPTNANELVFQVTFSESVTGVGTGDFTLNASGASGNITSVSSSSGTVIDVTIGSVSGDGTLELELNSSGTGITDDAGNAISGGYTAGDVYTIDNTAPSVSSILYDTPASSPTNAAELVFQVTFSESVSGVNTDDFTLALSGASGTISTVSANSGTVIDVTVNSVSGDGTIELELNNSGTGIIDGVGNSISGGYTSGDVYSVDRIAPTITISSTADDTTNVTPVPFTVQFSEDVSGFDVSDLSITATNTGGGGPGADINIQNFVAVDANTYTFEVAVTYDVATLDINISSGVCQDATTNDNTAATEYTVLYDETFPIPTVTSAETSPTNSSSIPFQVTFDKNVDNFIETDIVVGKGSVSNFVKVSKKVYTFDVNPSSDGLVTVDIPAAVCTDGPGNPNSAAIQYVITYDNTNPEINAVNIESDQSNDSFVGIGGVVILTITGSENIVLNAGDVLIEGQQATLAGSGKNWSASYTMTSSEVEGNVDFTIDYQDITGNTGTTVSATTNGSSVTFDKTLPTLKTAAPAINIVSNNTTNTAFAKAGDEVIITFESNEEIEFVVVKVEGKSAVVTTPDNLAFTAKYTLPSSGITDGVLDFTIDFKDLSGNSGTQVTATTDGSSVTFDATPPTVPSNLDLLDDDGRSATDNITKSTNPNFAGDAEAFSTVRMYSNIDGLLGTVAASNAGKFSINAALTEGDHSITATATDGSGNVSSFSLALSVKIDVTAPVKPGTPDMDGASDTGTSSTDNLTNDQTPTIAGSTEANARVSVYDGGVYQGFADADIFGVWSFTLPSLSINVTHSITVSATDLAGNIGSLSDPLVISIDGTAPATPAAPQIDAGSDTGTPGDNVTSDATPLVKGATEANAVIALYSSVDGLIGTATADGSGDWSITTSTLSGGAHNIYYTATDVAGNPSLASAILVFVIDNSIPAKPSAPDLITSSDLGVSTTDNITSDDTPDISGSAEANTNIEIYLGNTLVNTVTTDVLGNYAYTFGALTDGNYSIRVICSDLAGNRSNISDILSISIDTNPPVLSAVSFSSSNTRSEYAKNGDDVTLNFSASENIQQPVVLIDGKAIVISGGPTSWIAKRTMDGSETEGTLVYQISFSDIAGNDGTAVTQTTDLSYVIFDKTAPVLSGISIASDHSNPDRARVGSQVNLAFNSSETINQVAVNLKGKSALVSTPAANQWLATGYMSSSDVAGTVTFTIDYADLAGNAGTQESVVDDASSVVFDKTVPGYTSVSIFSDNLDPAYAVNGNLVTVDFETTESVETPQVEINGLNATSITGGPTVWSASRVVASGETEGKIPFSINIEDLAGNVPVEKFSTTDNSSVTYDDTNPSVSAISVNSGTYHVGDIITVLIQSDNITYTGSTVQVNGKVQTLDNNLNNNYTIEYQVEEGDTEISSSASLPVNIVLKDPAGLTTSVTSATVNGGTISIDAITPLISQINSNAEADKNAIIGDEIIFTVKPVVPETGLIIQPATYNGQSLNWTTTDGSAYTGVYTVIEGDPEQDVPLQLGQVTISDAAGNIDTDNYNLVGNKIFTAYPTVAINGTTTKCDYGQTVPVSFSFTGRKPFELVYSDGANVFGPLSINSSNYIINVEDGVYSVISLTDSTGNFVNAATKNATITVVDLPEISTSYTNSPYSIESPRDGLSQYVLQADKRTGVFSGEGVGYADGAYYFYPNNIPAALLDKDVDIIYTYTNPLTSCFNTDTNTIFVSSTPVSIIGLQQTYCEYDAAVEIGGNLPSKHTGQFQVFDADSVVYTTGWQQTDSVTLQLAPTSFEPGTYTLVYTAFKYPGMEATNLKSTEEFVIEALPENILITDLLPEYCFDNESSDIEVNVNFDPPIGSIGNFIPGDGSQNVFRVEAGEHQAFFKLSDAERNTPYSLGYLYESESGCIADTVFHDVIVNPLPQLAFNLDQNYNYDVQNIPLEGTPVDQAYSFSGEGVSRDTLFTAAARLNVPLIVTYSGSDLNGCYNEVRDTTIIYRATETIQGINGSGIYCYIDTAISISCTPVNAAATGGAFRSLRNAVVNTVTNSAEYYIDSIGSGADTLYFDYTINGTAYTVSKAVFVDSIGEVSISSSRSSFEFCNSLTSVRVNANKQYTDGGTDYFVYYGSSGVPVENLSNSINIDPVSQDPGAYELHYLFTSNRGCTSDTTQVITILPEPVVDFYQPVSCPVIGEPVEFENQTSFSGNEQDIAWEWSFEGQTITDKDPVYSFNSDGSKEVELTATVTGCAVSESKNYTIGNTAIADFSWDNECATGDAVNLKNLSSGGVREQGTFIWKVNGETLATTLNASFQPDQIGEYLIELDFTSNENCQSEISKELVIQPYIHIKDDYTNGTYIEDFETDQQYYQWHSKGLSESDTSRWELGLPQGKVINTAASGANAWYTYLNTTEDIENSQIVSPCFDFRGLEKPMIKLNTWSNSENNRDGAVLQYSTDIGKTWQNLGEIEEGINWFNSQNIQSQPGKDLESVQFIGWNKDEISNWQTARHNLDNLYNEPNVRFRIAYACDATNSDDFDGFAFDDVWIGDRQQRVLTEYFTNTISGLDEVDQYMSDYETIDSADIVSIHYHTGTPEGDKLFELYPNGPLTRVYYYGVGGLPLAISNGVNKYDVQGTAERTAFENTNDTSSLKDPKIAIAIAVFKSTIEVQLTALDDLSNDDLVLYTALVKEKIESESDGEEYYNILQRFMPDPSGVVLETYGFAAGENITKQINPGNFSATDLAESKLVVFVQNTKTNEVLQVVEQSIEKLTAVRNAVTATTSIYPNPVRNELYIESESIIDEIRILDISGRVLTIIQPGQEQLSIPFGNYRNGIYFIKGRTSNGDFMKKIIKN